jgi:hypothetical protein
MISCSVERGDAAGTGKFTRKRPSAYFSGAKLIANGFKPLKNTAA